MAQPSMPSAPVPPTQSQNVIPTPVDVTGQPQNEQQAINQNNDISNMFVTGSNN